LDRNVTNRHFDAVSIVTKCSSNYEEEGIIREKAGVRIRMARMKRLSG
jgi:hypothetical protein